MQSSSISEFLSLKFNPLYPKDIIIQLPPLMNYQLDIHFNNVLLERYIFYGACALKEMNLQSHLMHSQLSNNNHLFTMNDLKFCLCFENEKYEFTIPVLSKTKSTVITPVRLDLKTQTPCFQENADLFINTTKSEFGGQVQIMIDQLYGSTPKSKYPAASQFKEINNLDSQLSSLSISKSHKINIPRGTNFARKSPTSPLANSFRDLPFPTDIVNNNHNQRRQSWTGGKSPRNHGSFVGSFEQSLLAGRIPAPFSNPIIFHSSLSITFTSSKSKIIKFMPTFVTDVECFFYKLEQHQLPYSGELNLSQPLMMEYSNLYDEIRGGLKIPGSGQIQILMKNTQGMVVKVFLVPFDFRDMPNQSKTFIRQKFYDDGVLKDAVHLKFYCLKSNIGKKQIYMESSIRVVFSCRPSFEKANEPKIRKTTEEGPQQKYFPM